MCQTHRRLIRLWSKAPNASLLSILSFRPAAGVCRLRREICGLRERQVPSGRAGGARQGTRFCHYVWIMSSRNRGYQAFLRNARQSRGRDNTRTTNLHLAVESVISYGDRTPQERTKKRSSYNRDVSAILHLYETGILPDEVVRLAKREGEGPEAWATKRRVRKRKETVSSPPDPDWSIEPPVRGQQVLLAAPRQKLVWSEDGQSEP